MSTPHDSEATVDVTGRLINESAMYYTLAIGKRRLMFRRDTPGVKLISRDGNMATLRIPRWYAVNKGLT